MARLLDEFRGRHPALEIEGCSGGAGRVDLGILERTDRIWASDTNDPVERQSIDAGPASCSRRNCRLPLRGANSAHHGPGVTTAFRWSPPCSGTPNRKADQTRLSPEELGRLSPWAALYRELRHSSHRGDRGADHPDPGAWVHGVAAGDRSQAP